MLQSLPPLQAFLPAGYPTPHGLPLLHPRTHFKSQVKTGTPASLAFLIAAPLISYRMDSARSLRPPWSENHQSDWLVFVHFGSRQPRSPHIHVWQPPRLCYSQSPRKMDSQSKNGHADGAFAGSFIFIRRVSLPPPPQPVKEMEKTKDKRNVKR